MKTCDEDVLRIHLDEDRSIGRRADYLLVPLVRSAGPSRCARVVERWSFLRCLTAVEPIGHGH